MKAATEGSLPPVIPEGNLVEVLGREVRQGLPGELMMESSPSRQRQPPCKTNKEMSDEAAHAAALTYLLTQFAVHLGGVVNKFNDFPTFCTHCHDCVDRIVVRWISCISNAILYAPL